MMINVKIELSEYIFSTFGSKYRVDFLYDPITFEPYFYLFMGMKKIKLKSDTLTELKEEIYNIINAVAIQRAEKISKLGL